jgi:4'-phosphopantetheinyl transferase
MSFVVTDNGEFPVLADDEVHVWRLPWTPGAGDPMPRQRLADYVGVSVAELVVVRGEHGKPTLAAPHDGLAFSWSHSGDVALLAVARGLTQLGVDVERVRPRSRVLELAARFFDAGETDLLRALPEREQLGAFLDLWTAKESVLKAHGGGLVYGLHRVVFAQSGGLTSAQRFEGELAPASAWQLHALELGESWHASLAWRGKPRRIRLYASRPA